MIARLLRVFRRLVADESGDASTNFLSLATTMPLGIGLSFMTMQLFQSAHHRDAVDFATSIAADEVTKTLCSPSKNFGGVPRGVFAGERKRSVEVAVTSRLAPVVGANACRVEVRPKAAATLDPGALPMEVEVTCEAPCTFPLAAQVMCTGSPAHLTLTGKQTAVAMGCDAGEAW